jgi:hypothetical protein
MSTNTTRADWDVRVEDGTAVVELPAGIELDRETGEAINEAFAEAVARPTTDGVLTLLRVEDPLGSGLFEEVQEGARLAAENGIDRWAVTVERRVKGMAFENQVEGLETDVFEAESAARDWVA